MVLEVGPQDKTELIKTGPVTTVSLGPNGSGMRQVRALVDTGAESSFIDQGLAEELNLYRIDRHPRRVSDVLKQHACQVFEAHIVGGDLEIPSPRQFPALSYLLANMSVPLILGRDVLANLHLSYDGPTGSVKLTRPRVEFY